MARYGVGVKSYPVLGTVYLPFKTALTREDLGKAVTIVDDFKVGLGSVGDPIVGQLTYVEEDGGCTVAVGPALVFAKPSGASVEAGGFVAVSAGYVTTVSSDVPGAKLVIGVENNDVVVLM